MAQRTVRPLGRRAAISAKKKLIHRPGRILLVVAADLYVQRRPERRAQGQQTDDTAQIRPAAAAVRENPRTKPAGGPYELHGLAQMQTLGPGYRDFGMQHRVMDPAFFVSFHLCREIFVAMASPTPVGAYPGIMESRHAPDIP